MNKERRNYQIWVLYRERGYSVKRLAQKYHLSKGYIYQIIESIRG